MYIYYDFLWVYWREKIINIVRNRIYYNSLIDLLIK